MLRQIQMGCTTLCHAYASIRKSTLALAMAVAAIPAIAHADGNEALLRHTAPHKWIDPFTPEKLPELTFPLYFKDLDKAKSLAFHGRFKQAILQLANVKPTKPEDFVAVALIRATALDALGRQETALKTLQEKKVAKDPAVEVRRAELLAGMGRQEEALALLKQHVADHPDSIAGHYWLGAISEEVGHIAEAKEAFGCFEDKPQDFKDRFLMHERTGPFESAESVT